MSKTVLKYSGLGPVSMPNGAGGVLTIKPGITEMPSIDFDKMKVQPDIKKMLERGAKSPNDFDPKTGVGNISIVSSDKKVETVSDESGDDVVVERVPGNAKDAKALVNETEDTSLLSSWLETDDRAGVKNAIEKKLKEIADYREEHGDREE